MRRAFPWGIRYHWSRRQEGGKFAAVGIWNRGDRENQACKSILEVFGMFGMSLPFSLSSLPTTTLPLKTYTSRTPSPYPLYYLSLPQLSSAQSPEK